MKILTSIVVVAGLAFGVSGAMAQSSSNGTPAAVPGVGPGGNGAQSGSGTDPMVKGTAGQQSKPGSVTTDPASPTNTTGQPAGDKPAQ